MAKSRRRRVWERACGCCEYCRLPQSCTNLPHELDHIRAAKHHGHTTLGNLCLACAACNTYKSCNAAGFDPHSGALVRLFNPRKDRWTDHFQWQGPRLLGKTAEGRATIDVLKINANERVVHRRILMALGLFTAGEEQQ